MWPAWVVSEDRSRHAEGRGQLLHGKVESSNPQKKELAYSYLNT